MRDFVGLENADLTAKDAMVKFSYLSAIGNMDEAFKAIKAIKRYLSWFLQPVLCRIPHDLLLAGKRNCQLLPLSQ